MNVSTESVSVLQGMRNLFPEELVSYILQYLWLDAPVFLWRFPPGNMALRMDVMIVMNTPRDDFFVEVGDGYGLHMEALYTETPSTSLRRTRSAFFTSELSYLQADYTTWIDGNLPQHRLNANLGVDVHRFALRY